MAAKPKKDPRNVPVTALDTTDEVAARQPEDVPRDGRFHKVVTVSAHAEDWEAPEHDSMHAANRLATIQEALGLGLHPQEEARYDGSELVPGNRGRHTTRLAYSVAVVPADQAVPSETIVPAKVLAASGGTTQAE